MSSKNLGQGGRLWSLLAVFVFLTLALSFGHCIQDDSFISFRYAENFARGFGLSYNPGTPVEGYTNFLWTIILAGFAWLKLDILNWSVGASLLSGIALIWLGGRFAYRLEGSDRSTSAMIPLLLALNAGFALEGVQALETLFYALLVGLAFVQRLEELERSERGPKWSVFWVALAALTRPEGYFLFGIIELVPAIHAWLEGRLPELIRRRIAWLPIFFVFTGAHNAFRLLYYRSLIPNTFYAKVGASDEQFFRGLHYVASFFLAYPVVGLLFGFGVLRALRGPAGARRSLMLALPLSYLLYVCLVGGDFKVSWRFILPVLLPVLVLSANLASELQRRSRIAFLPLLLVLASLLLGTRRAYPSALASADQRALEYRTGRTVGLWLRRNTPPDTTIALYPAGVIPYYSRLYTIDMWGLSVPAIARERMETMGQGTAGHEKSDNDWVFAQKPDLYVPYYSPLTKKPVRLSFPEDFPQNFENEYRLYSNVIAEEQTINLWARTDRPLPWVREARTRGGEP